MNCQHRNINFIALKELERNAAEANHACLGAKGEAGAKSLKCRGTECQRREDLAVIPTKCHLY